MEAAARRALPDDYAPVTDALRALQQLAGEVLAVKDLFRRQIESLRARHDLIGREEMGAMVSAYERALDRGGKLLTDMAKIDIDGRLAAVEETRVQVQEREADLFIAGMQWLLAGFGLEERLPDVEAAVSHMIDRLAVGEVPSGPLPSAAAALDPRPQPAAAEHEEER